MTLEGEDKRDKLCSYTHLSRVYLNYQISTTCLSPVYEYNVQAVTVI